MNEISPPLYLIPFLEVIRSEHITGPITGLALVALKKFVDYGFLTAPLSRRHSHSGDNFKQF